ncbi:MAG: hypothetical protein RLZ97_414 [Verrucomicrobiota bacterium]
MNLLTEILTFVGFIAITFGAAGTISKWLKASEDRKRTLADHNAAVLAALRRIEVALGETSKSKLP